MKKVLVAIAGAALLTLTFSLGGSTSPAQAQGYGMAGCGLGSMLFGNDPGLIQIIAGTTNSTFGTQTFGITSGTSNCVDSAKPVISVRAFIETNREILAKDISRGSGETIETLSTMAGCSDDAGVGRSLQRNFRAIFPTTKTSDVEVSSRVIHILQTDASLACGKLS